MDCNDALKNLRTSLQKDCMKPGSIFKMDLTPEDGMKLEKGKKSKPKYIVIVGIKEDGTMLVAPTINSRPAPTPMLEQYQYPLYPKDYKFLDHISYLNCAHLFPLPTERVEAGRYIDHLKQHDLELITQCILEADTTSPKIIRIYNIGK